MTTQNKPLHRVRYGFVNITIWENQGEKGVYHTMTIDRSYRDGDQWKSTASFRRSDLASIAFAVQKAEAYLAEFTNDAVKPAEESAA